MADWRAIEPAVNATSALKASTTSEEACLAWIRAFAAVHICGRGKAMTLADGAAAVTELGLPTTPEQLADAGKKARARHHQKTGKLTPPPAEMDRF